MTAYPEMVSGTARSDLLLMQAGMGNWVAKGGAEGVQAIGVRSAGLGVTIKIADGNARALQAVTISVLCQLGLADAAVLAAFGERARPRIKNLRDIPIGEIRPVVRLQSA
jgi:L-asparaginase II